MSEKVSVIGLWHLGLVNCVGFCEKGYIVNGLDFNHTLISNLKNNRPPLFEPGLEERIRKHTRSGNLVFSGDPVIIKQSDYVVIAYDSPVNDEDEVSITPIIEAAEKISTFLNPKTPVVITSQVPLGSCEKIEKMIRKKNSHWQSGVVYTPENLRLGNAIELFLEPDMIVLGSDNQKSLKSSLKLYQPFITKKFQMNLRSAEMVKHAINTFLATSIAFGNEIANLSDRLGADSVLVAQALKADRRIGKAPILPGLGFSGGTLARDVQQLKIFSEQLKYPGHLLQSITEINEDSFNQIILKLKSKLGSLKNKKIGILGLTYKPGTSTMRRSPTVKIIGKLLTNKAICLAYDPKVDDNEVQSYSKSLKRVDSVEELARESDALVLVTEWPEFKDFDYGKLAKLMKTPILIDAKNFLDPKKLVSQGFDYIGYGRKLSKENI